MCTRGGLQGGPVLPPLVPGEVGVWPLIPMGGTITSCLSPCPKLQCHPTLPLVSRALSGVPVQGTTWQPAQLKRVYEGPRAAAGWVQSPASSTMGICSPVLTFPGWLGPEVAAQRHMALRPGISLQVPVPA